MAIQRYEFWHEGIKFISSRQFISSFLLNIWKNWLFVQTTIKIERDITPKSLQMMEGHHCIHVPLCALSALVTTKTLYIAYASSGFKRGDEWSFKNSGSYKILVEFHGSCAHRSLSFFFFTKMLRKSWSPLIYWTLIMYLSNFHQEKVHPKLSESQSKHTATSFWYLKNC